MFTDLPEFQNRRKKKKNKLNKKMINNNEKRIWLIKIGQNKENLLI